VPKITFEALTAESQNWN